MKNAARPFRIGSKGNWLMWLVGGVGFAGSLLAFVLSFFPPGQINVGGNTIWFSVLIGGVVLFVVLPFIIYACRKPSWVNPTSNFVPFHWETSPESQKLLAEAKASYEAEQNGTSSDADAATATTSATDSHSADSADNSKS